MLIKNFRIHNPFCFPYFLCSQKFQIPCSSLLSISFVILTYKTKTLYFLLNEWMDVLQCLVPSRNTIKVSGEKATSKRKTNSMKGKAHKVALNSLSFKSEAPQKLQTSFDYTKPLRLRALVQFLIVLRRYIGKLRQTRPLIISILLSQNI